MTVQLFALPGFGSAVAEAPGVEPRECTVARFACGELHVELDADVCGQDCVVVGSLAPPEEQLVSFALVADTLDNEGARSVTALLPYLAYARQDRDEPRRSVAAAWTGWLLEASGFDRVVTIDVHSPAVAAMYPLPLESLSAAGLFADEIARLGLDDFVVVAPDDGATHRAGLVAVAADADRPVLVIHKRRTREGIVHLGMSGALAPQAVVVDDILDTGSTLVSSCGALRDAGVEDITIFTTHGLFTGRSWQPLCDGLCDRLYVTDTVPHPDGVPDGVRVLRVDGLLADRVAQIAAAAPATIAPDQESWAAALP